MKYCTRCRKVHDDSVGKCCEVYSWEKKPAFNSVPDEVLKCTQCGSTTDLTYHEPFKIGSSSYGNYCTCAECNKKMELAALREDSMKYLLVNNDDGEIHLFGSSRDVDDFFEEYAKDYESCGESIDMVLLKLESINKVTEKDFKEPKNTHIVVYDCELYKVEEVIVPELEMTGEREIHW